MSASHEESRQLLGAYVLGGLDDADVRTVQDHLPGCELCREELATLAFLPGVLRRRPEPQDTQPGLSRPGVSVPGVPALGLSRPRISRAPSPVTPEPPSALLPDLLLQVRAERQLHRRRSSLRLAVAAVTVGVLTAGAGALLPLGGGESAGTPINFAASDGSTAAGQVQLVAKPWGTEITIALAGLPTTGQFALRATGQDGSQEQAASWGATATGVSTVVGATSLTLDDVGEVAVVGPDGRVLAVAST